MSWNRVAEILDLEGAFDSRGEEATEGCDERGKRREEEDMELDWGDGDGCGEAVALGPRSWNEGDVVGMWVEDRVRFAVEACPEVCAEILRARVSLSSFDG